MHVFFTAISSFDIQLKPGYKAKHDGEFVRFSDMLILACDTFGDSQLVASHGDHIGYLGDPTTTTTTTTSSGGSQV